MAQQTHERNPETTQRYKREVWWQVLFPIIMVTGLLIVFVILIYPLFGLLGASTMADYSVLFIFALITTFWVGGIAIIGGLIYALAKALEVIPSNTYKAQKALNTARDVTDEYTDKMAEAIIAQRARAVGVAAAVDSVRSKEAKKKPGRATRTKKADQQPKAAKSEQMKTKSQQKVIIVRGKIHDKQ